MPLVDDAIQRLGAYVNGGIMPPRLAREESPVDVATSRTISQPFTRVNAVAPVTLTLPHALGSGNPDGSLYYGQLLVIKSNTGGPSDVTIQGEAGCFIDGAASVVLKPGEGVVLVSADPGDWRRVGGWQTAGLVTPQAATGALTDSTGGTPAAAVVATTAAVTAAGVSLEADLTGADTMDKTKTQANFAAIGTELGKLKVDGLAAQTALAHANDDVASLAAKVNALRTELLAAGVLT